MHGGKKVPGLLSEFSNAMKYTWYLYPVIIDGDPLVDVIDLLNVSGVMRNGATSRLKN